MATAAQQKAGTHQFQAEVAKLLHLMVHSVYSDRDVFLRELISNASDACNKLRYEAIARPELVAGDSDLKITITPDKKARTLSLADNGIGMSEEELLDNLGTIAKSGTQAFVEKTRGEAPDLRLIGQFGVGFYSAFIVASKVEVYSRQAGSEQGHVWVSEGEGTFSVTPSPDAPARGTRIVLHLKEDALEFLEDWKIEQVVRAYSDHVAHPIMLAIDKDTARQINQASAIWTRAKSDVSADQHKEFLAHLAGTSASPALTLHYRAEGRNEYRVLLYVPSERPFDLYDPERRGRQKLYVKRVFITDDAELLPAYLRFVRGVIDSEDMPLNLSREMLQNNPQVAAIRKAVTNKVLGELKKLSEADAAQFSKMWEIFGPVIKEGLYEDFERRDQIYEFARFNTTKAQNVTLKNYIEGLQPNQKAIYYLTADDAAKAAKSPQLEGYTSRGIEVLLLTDPVDGFWVRTALGFDGKPFRSITQGADDLDAIPLKDTTPPAETDTGAIGVLVAALKQVLGEKVKDVRRSSRLTDSAVCLVNDSDMDRTLEKLLSRQKTTGITLSAPVLEINANHPLIAALARQAKSKGTSPEIADAAFLLLDQAHILEGEPLDDPQGFARRMADLMGKVFT
jgi:molecular chaperone HtpG